jgi:predicted small lipoprotein YifL
MKQTLLVLILASFFLAACGGPGGQALPEQERENFEKILQEEANKNK